MSPIMTSKEAQSLLPYLTEQEKELLDRILTNDALWLPLPGPQLAAYLSEADELFYGGQAGGGKSYLLIGLALIAHRNSIIFRREFPQLLDIRIKGCEILSGTNAKYGINSMLWRNIPGDRILEFGYCQYDKDLSRYKGRAHDLTAFDEVSDFTEYQYKFLTAWTRSVIPGQRVRIVAAGNPPTSTEGEWIIKYWAPWLDGKHPNPARPGELRWFARIDDEDVEVESEKSFEHKGELIRPRSRTFIPATLSDNPYLANDEDYVANLQGQYEPLRSQLLYGDFTVGTVDDAWQIIPTEWVRLAQARSRERPKDEEGKPVPLTALGVDVARGGKDQTVLIARYDSYFEIVGKHPGKTTPDGPSVAALVVKALDEDKQVQILAVKELYKEANKQKQELSTVEALRAQVMLDVIGVGSSVYDILRSQSILVRGINFAEGTKARDKTRQLKFRNVRAETYWRFREALDPVSGDSISLPDDSEILADLTAPRWSMSTSGIQVESKEDIIKRLKRSPDVGDAIVLSNTPRRTARI